MTNAMRKTTGMLAALLLLSGSTFSAFAAEEPAPYLPGDINEDGAVSVEDAQLTLKAYTQRVAGLDTELTARQHKAADVNGDSTLSVDDAQNILKYYTQKTVAGKDITWEEILRDQPKPDTNFFGGKGKLHVLRCRKDGADETKDILYDDTLVYINGGASYADRFSEHQVMYYDMPAEAAQFYSHVLYDDCGGFLYADGQSLYLLENDGSHPDAPFFTLTGEMLKDGQDSSKFVFKNAVKMTDTAYLITMEGAGSTVTAVCGTDGSVHWLADGFRYYRFLRGTDGSVYAVVSAAGNDCKIVRIQADGTTETCTEFSGSGNHVEHMALNSSTLYILLSSADENGSVQRQYFAVNVILHDIVWTGKVWLMPGETLEYAFLCGEQPFFVVYIEDKKIDDIVGMNSKMERRYGGIDTEGFAYSRYFDEQREESRLLNFWADDQYIMMMLTGDQYVLYDTTLESQTLRVFIPEWAPAESPEALN